MSKSTTVNTVDLNVAHTAGDPAVVQIHAHEFYVSQVGPGDHGATIHLDGPNGDGEPAEPGPFTSDDGQPFSTIYVVNEAAGEASKLQIVTRDGYCRRQEPTYRTVPAEAATSFNPERLSGALAAATTIADGAEASEEVDTAGATTLRIRARVSGTARVEALGSFGDGDTVDPRSVAVDVAGARAWIGGEDAGNIVVEFDISDPENPTKNGTVTNADLAALWGLEYDATNDVLVGHSKPGGASTVVVLDVSTPGAPAFSGSVALSQDGDEADIVLDPSAQLAYLATKDSSEVANGDLAVVDYSAPATPSLESSIAARWSHLDVDIDRGLLYVGLTTDDLRVYSIADPTNLALIVTRAFDGTSSPFGLTIVDGEDLLWVLDESGTGSVPRAHVYIYDTSRRDELTLLESVVLDDNGGTFNWGPEKGVAYTPDADLLAVPGSTDYAILDVSDPLAPRWLVDFTDSNNVSGSYGSTWRQDDSGQWIVWVAANANDQLTAVGVDQGGDRLRLYVTNPGGSRSTTKTPATVTLEDGREGAVDMDLAGEDTIEIEVAGRSGVQTTVDYVDVYRAT